VEFSEENRGILAYHGVSWRIMAYHGMGQCELPGDPGIKGIRVFSPPEKHGNATPRRDCAAK